MHTTITVEGKFDHSAIMKNAHIAAANLRMNNSWMTYKQAFAKAIRDEYCYARATKAAMVVVGGQVMVRVDIDTRGD